MSEPETATFAGFARRLGVKPQAVTALRHADRLVLTADGKRVLVAESLARLALTADPSKAGVVARHAAARDPEPAADPEGEEGAAGEPAATVGYQHWRERNEKAKALAGERMNAVEEGKLMVAEEVTSAIARATTTLRTQLERLPAELAPMLAATSDEGHARALLAEAIEHALEDLARQFQAVGKGQQ
ncbi:MAG TPA: hypothetical protein VN624_14380 [Rhodanobacter sp.]|nr:hypothetical protein [Rhodanobacter sp.]